MGVDTNKKATKSGCSIYQKKLDAVTRKIQTFVTTVGQKIKKVQAKKLVKSNKSISRNFVLDKFHYYAISKMAKNQFLNWEKV